MPERRPQTDWAAATPLEISVAAVGKPPCTEGSGGMWGETANLNRRRDFNPKTHVDEPEDSASISR